MYYAKDVNTDVADVRWVGFLPPTKDNRIDRLLIGTAHLPCFGSLIMPTATTKLRHHNPVQKINFIVISTT
jgi:hypothetical protein